jgi:DNA replication initiation complex subunit (GINS family)
MDLEAILAAKFQLRAAVERIRALGEQAPRNLQDIHEETFSKLGEAIESLFSEIDDIAHLDPESPEFQQRFSILKEALDKLADALGNFL